MVFVTIIEKYIVFFYYILYFPEGKNICYGYIDQKNIV